MGVINKLLGRLKLYSDPAVTTQTTTVIQSDTTNSSIALVPNGTGAIIASVPDGTTTGGNARGQYAIDLQTYRTNANQVASGIFNVILGGSRHRTLGEGSVIAGGDSNIASNNGAVVSGGYNHTSSGQYSTVSGGFGNNATSNYSTVSGGQSNTASTNTHATVVGGSSNTASGNAASVVGGANNISSGTNSVVGNINNISSGFSSTCFGSSNTVTGNHGFIAGGNSNTANDRNIVLAGESNQATSPFSVVSGFYGLTYLRQQRSIGSRFDTTGSAGNCQISDLIACRLATLNTAATTVLSLDGTGTTNLIIPNGTNRMWKVKVEWISTVTTITGTATGITVGDMAYGEANFGFKKVSGTSVLGNFINDEEASDSAIMDTCTLGYSVGASQELALTFTGPTFSGGGSVTMRVVAKVSLVEVAY